MGYHYYCHYYTLGYRHTILDLEHTIGYVQ